MHIEFQNTNEELWAAHAAHRSSGRRFFGDAKGIFAWVLFVGLAIMLFILLRRPTSSAVAQPAPQSSGPDLGLWLSVAFLVLFCSFVVFIIVWVRFKRARKDQPNEQPHQKWDLADSGVIIDLGTSRTQMQWGAFCRSLEASTVFLLYATQYSYHVVPKRAFASAEQTAEFADLVHRHIQPRRQASS